MKTPYDYVLERIQKSDSTTICLKFFGVNAANIEKTTKNIQDRLPFKTWFDEIKPGTILFRKQPPATESLQGAEQDNVSD